MKIEEFLLSDLKIGDKIYCKNCRLNHIIFSFYYIFNGHRYSDIRNLDTISKIPNIGHCGIFDNTRHAFVDYSGLEFFDKDNEIILI